MAHYLGGEKDNMRNKLLALAETGTGLGSKGQG